MGPKQIRQITPVLITSPPGVNDDALQNYKVGSLVYSISDQTFYECSDATAGAAVWGAVSFGGGGWIVVSANQNAVNDEQYSNVANATYTDPTPAEGKGFIVLVRNGTATVGGTGYSVAGTLVYRFYHSGAWANYPFYSGVPQDSSVLSNTASNTTVIAGATEYAALFGGPTTDGTNESGVQSIIPFSGNISRLYIRTTTAQPGTGSYVITLRLNGADTAMVITIAAGAAAGIFTDLVNVIPVVAGDLISLKLENNASSASAMRTSASALFTRS